MTERIRCDAAARILGVTVRSVQALAQRGEIPAAKVGGVYTFDEHKLRAWLTRKEVEQCSESEVETCRKGATGAADGSGSARRSTVGSTEKAYEQMMSQLRRGRPKSSARV